MEETHYSTSEELQATIQELADLQQQLSVIQTDNDRLSEEKDVLFQSLCRQTEKLEDSRTKIGKLQELLLRDSDQLDTVLSSQYEKNLLELLNNAQEERESLLAKHKELQAEVKELRSALEQSDNDNLSASARSNLLDATGGDSKNERNQIDGQTGDGDANGSSDREVCDLRDLVEAMRKEKSVLEAAVTKLQDSLSSSQCEVQMLKEQILSLNEEYKLSRTSAKGALSDLEYKYDQLKKEKLKLSVELQMSQDTVNELQMQGKCHLDDKSQLETCLTENQRHLCDLKRRLAEKDDQLNNEKKLRKFENEEWKQFQADLLMTVRVANDFKAEAQRAHEQVQLENKTLRNRIRALEQEIIKLNKGKRWAILVVNVSSLLLHSFVSAMFAENTNRTGDQLMAHSQTICTLFFSYLPAMDDQEKTTILNTVSQEMAMRAQRAGISRQDSRISVKSLIESIEKSQQNVSAILIDRPRVANVFVCVCEWMRVCCSCMWFVFRLMHIWFYETPNSAIMIDWFMGCQAIVLLCDKTDERFTNFKNNRSKYKWRGFAVGTLRIVHFNVHRHRHRRQNTRLCKILKYQRL